MNIFESQIILWIQENVRGPIGDVFWKCVTHLGDDGILWIILGIVLLCFKKTRTMGFTVLLSLLFDFLIINVALKGLVARPRPYVVNELIQPLVGGVSPHRSFPSGHSGGSFSAMLALYRWVPKKIGVPAVILASLVALSRLYVGVHYPTDIIGGFAIGLLCSTLAYLVVTKVVKKMGEKKLNG